MQGRDRELLKESHDAYIEKSNRPNDHDESEKMQNHHERPPPLTESHGFAEFFWIGLKIVDDGRDGSFRYCSFCRCHRLAGPNFRMADITTRVPGSGHEAHRQKRKKQHSCDVPVWRLRGPLRLPQSDQGESAGGLHKPQ